MASLPIYNRTGQEVGKYDIDTALLAPEINKQLLHDVVVMHRVVCCYPDVDRLVGVAAAHTRRRLLLTYPREGPWTRAGIWSINLFMRISGSSFRAFVHPVARMAAAAQREGLTLERRERRGAQPRSRHQRISWTRSAVRQNVVISCLWRRSRPRRRKARSARRRRCRSGQRLRHR